MQDLNLLEGHETRRVVGTDTGTAVTDRTVGDGELTQVHANHVCGNVCNVEDLTVVHSDLGTNHVGDNDHVAKVGLDGLGAIQGTGGSLSLLELVDVGHVLAAKSSLHSSSCASKNEVDELLLRKIEHLLELQTPEGKLLKLSLLTKCGDCLNIKIVSHIYCRHAKKVNA